jgi:hypothetical protein
MIKAFKPNQTVANRKILYLHKCKRPETLKMVAEKKRTSKYDLGIDQLNFINAK